VPRVIEENTRTHTKPLCRVFFFAECNTRPSGLCDSNKSVPNVPKTLGKDPLHRVFSICQSVSGNCPEGPCAECFILSVALESAYA
jgi:hypothetical protein